MWFYNPFINGEEQATAYGQRGWPKSVGSKLSAQKEAHIRKLIIEMSPKQHKFDFALWTRRAGRALIKRDFQIDISVQTVGIYLRSWGMSEQCPACRAIEQDDGGVRKWKQEEYPAIAERARAENAVIN